MVSSVFPNTLDDKNLEYIELVNLSTQSGSLDGYILSDKSGKEYHISELILGPGEKHQFLRPETKLILNNTKEEVFLKNSSGETIDEVQYDTSTKGEVIVFLESQEGTISDESYLQIWYSDEAEVSEKEPPEKQEDILLPEIRWEFQQPSYVLEKEKIQETYVCDGEKDTCKINFNFLSSFTEDFSVSDYTCQTSFGFDSGQENRCNPNTIVFPEGEFEVMIQIISKTDTSQYTEKKILIQNTPQEPEPLEDNSEDEKEEEEKKVESTDETDTSQKTIAEGPAKTFQAPNVHIELQRPSYVFLDSEEIYQCDRSKTVCKINLDLRESFSETFDSRDYMCENIFPTETGYENTCNPGTIEIALGISEFKIRIVHRDDANIFSEKTVSINNEGYSPTAKSASGSIPKYFLEIQKPEIIIQSGLTPNGKKYVCHGSSCKVNLEYEKRDSKERCLWNFGNGEFSASTARRCNPGYVDYQPGRHAITLRVYQNGNLSNYRESRIAFDVVDEEGQEPKQDTKELEKQEPENTQTSSQIQLQGTIGKNKILLGNTLVCYAEESCSVNFTSTTEGESDMSYRWDFGDGTTSERQNPLSKKFPPGEYRVFLHSYSEETILDTQEFFVQVLPPPENKKSVSEKEESPENYVFSGSLQISSLLINPSGNDIREWIEIENLENTVSLEGCFLKRGSKKYKFSQENILNIGEKRKVFRVFSNISLPNTQGSLELYCGEQLQDTIVWESKVGEGSVLFSGNSQTRSYYNISRDDFISEQEYHEFIDKSFHLNTRVLKSGLKITGETLANTNVQISSSQGYQTNIRTDADGLFLLLLQGGIQPGDHLFSFSFADELGETHYFESDSIHISRQDIANFFSASQKKSKKTSKKKTSLRELIIQEQETSDTGSNQELTLHNKILYTFGLVVLSLLGAILLLYQSLILSSPSIGHIYTTFFFTRQQVLLIIS